LALLKIVAGLTGLPLDDIRKRAAIADRRRIFWIGVVSAVLGVLALAAFGFAGVNWWVQQEEAQRDRTIAEINAKLDTIKSAQAGPGREQAVTAAVTAGVTAAAAGDPRAQQAVELLKAGKSDEAAALYRAMADERAEKIKSDAKTTTADYRHAAAIAGVRDPKTARELYAKALGFDPDDRESLLWLAWFSKEAGDLAESDRAAQHLLTLAESDKDDHDTIWAHSILGDISVAHGDLLNAQDIYRDSLAIADRSAKSGPGNAGWQRDLSVSHAKLGDVLVAEGDLKGALKSYQDGLEIIDRLAKSDPGNTGWQLDLAVSHDNVGDVLTARSDFPEALSSRRSAHDIFDRLAKSDPGNSYWQRELSVSDNKIGDVLVSEGDLTGAVKSYRDALAIRDRLAKSDPGNVRWQRDLCVSNERIGEMYLRQGDREEARKAFERALAAYEVMLTRSPGDVQSQVFSVVPRLRLAGLDPPKARSYLEGALAILKPLADANRLDANRLNWIPEIEAQLAALK
jgi:tetratricopeptide (TPR) repeat protein